MRLKFPEGFHRTLAFRLTSWYAAIFILGFLLLSIISYFFVFASIRDNRPAIRREMARYRALAEEGGLAAIERRVSREPNPSRRRSFFVRVVAPDDRTLLLGYPHLWANFDLTRPQDQLVAGQWHYYTSTRDADLLEVLSARLANGSLLQVGRSIQDRKDVFEHFRDTLLATLIPMVLIGVGGGGFLAMRALRPIRHINAAARSIVTTARFDTRVPGHETKDELSELVQLFNSMLERIETLIQGMKNSLDNVAHDLRTPVTRLRGRAEEALRSGGSAENCREALADCLEESERLMSMLATLLDISEAETGTMRLACAECDLGEVAAEVAELYADVAEENGVRLACRPGEPIRVRADRARIRQVLANLVDNAMKYTPAGGHVELKTAGDDSFAVLRVKDEGIGIAADEIPRIWDRLYRGDRSRSQRGLGLGLSLVKAVVHAHHGRVEVASKPGTGSVFSVYLPRSRGA